MPPSPEPPPALLPSTAAQLPRRQALHRLVAAGAALAPWAGSQAQPAYPQRPIQWQVPFGPGGIADLTARAVAQAMAGTLGQAVVVENKPGAGSIVASQAVAHASPDGHTLLLMSNGHAVAPSLFRTLPYDAQQDFAPVCALAAFDLAVFVAGGSGLRNWAELLAQARARPGRLTLATITVGSTQHLAAELLRHSAGLDLVLVPYKATPAVLTALRAGEVDAAVEILGPWLPRLQAGVLRALAVTGAQRHPALPEVPTLQQAGGAALKDYSVQSWNGLAAPARTPAAVIGRLNQAANAALASAPVLQQLHALGVRPLGGTPEQLQRLLADDTRRWAAVARRAGIEPQ